MQVFETLGLGSSPSRGTTSGWCSGSTRRSDRQDLGSNPNPGAMGEW